MFIMTKHQGTSNQINKIPIVFFRFAQSYLTPEKWHQRATVQVNIACCLAENHSELKIRKAGPGIWGLTPRNH